MRARNTTHPKLSNPCVLIALTFCWSWFFWTIAALSGSSVKIFSGNLLFGLGGIGPAVAAIMLLYFRQDKEAGRDYWRRLIDFKRIGGGWYAVTLLTIPLLTALAVLLDVLLGGNGA